MSRPGARPVRHILCGVDGSDAACRAAEQAAQLAVSLNADLTFLAVAEEGRADAAFEAYARIEGLQEEPPRFLKPEAELCLGLALRRAAEAGQAGAVSVIRTGEIANALLSVASERPVDMVVVGHRKTGRLHRAIAGSAAQDLSDDGRFMVLVVP